MTLVHNRITIWELTARNHLIQLLTCADAFGFVTSVRLPGGHIRLTYHQAQRLAIMTHRRIHIAHRGLAHSAEHRGTEHRFGSHRGIQFSAHFLLDNVANHIVGPQAHHRGWTTLFGNNVFALAILQNEQQISKTQVGDHLPVGDQMMQPFTIFVIEIGTGRQDM